MAAKIGVIGSKESVLPFQLFGFQVCYATAKAEVTRAFQCLVKEEYVVIYVTEKCAALIPEEIAKYQQQVSPAIILIPDYDGSQGVGLKMIQENVEKAVGQNIL
ncbi:V-type ATP synthase subunit F [Enterococcus gallinarum]|uniref:V-type ATP synthase subunit F n=1 Tax=Enterococcus gallinarum TaxID=1353 RepID=A0ABD4ZWQ5_ENTGA|nr:V-type ATP synthase subunit F [Enterococcus gallinarum]MBF0824934.1 V-type ATP synthase subunit F [Enterococcus faecalis]MBF0727203.1 V-type ATP synthase subunit F [Enterococcus gallinarum]MBF0798786.1 V-type ATP synthase subunit F [Enterococcus gallinarum]MBX8979199.1 V-type ATP synthase subunit F [Enterococcus gallinarum]MDL4876528.1 V-type ATP synthase subunit F [Enterococcus gallinarum]